MPKANATPTGFGTILRRERERSGKTKTAIAEAANVSLNTLVSIEQNSSEPSWPVACRIARALGVEVGIFAAELPPVEPAAPVDDAFLALASRLGFVCVKAGA